MHPGGDSLEGGCSKGNIGFKKSEGSNLMQVVINVLSPLKRPFPAVLRIVEVDEFELLVMIENVNKLFELSNIHLSGMTWHAQKPYTLNPKHLPGMRGMYKICLHHSNLNPQP
jgi:hypothetical protein